MSTSIINPWLTETLNQFRNRYSEKQLRDMYYMCSRSCKDLSWYQHNVLAAIHDAMRENPFLRTPRYLMELPKDVLDFLYWNDVDTMADLMQITEEELVSIARGDGVDVSVIKSYLDGHGLELLHCDKKNCKVRTLTLVKDMKHPKWETWEIHAPGAMPEFNIARPTLNERWFAEYYQRYGKIVNDNLFYKEFLSVKPDITKDGVPTDYREFFQSIGNLKESYLTICYKYHLQPRVYLPDMPRNVLELKSFRIDTFCRVWKDSLLAVIDILERTALFKYSSPGAFLAASDEQKLNIAEEEGNDSDFQLLLITHVEIKVDYENVFLYLNDLLLNPRQTVQSKKADRPEPMNPWLAEVLVEYRNRHSDDTLRAEYKRYLEHSPDTLWADFLAERALGEEMKRKPFIATRRKYMDLPRRTKNFLNANYIDTVADLLQITEEELVEVFGSRAEDLLAVRTFINKHNLHLYHHDGYTYKIGSDEIQKEKDRLKEILDRARQEAEYAMEKESDPFQTRVEKAYGLLAAADRLADQSDCDIRDHERVLRAYGILMEKNMLIFRGLMKNAPKIAQKYLSLMTEAFGVDSSEAAGGNRLYAAIQTKLDNHESAAEHYYSAGVISEKLFGDKSSRAAEDYNSAGICYHRGADIKKALEAFHKSSAIWERRGDGNPEEMSTLYDNMSVCYMALSDKENARKYHQLALAAKTTEKN